MSAISSVAITGLFFAATPSAFAAFGSTASGGGFIVDNGANMVVTINSAGDMSSLKFNGTEFNGGTPSGINSGLGAATVTSTTSGNYIKITCTSTWIAASPLIHYYIIRNGYNDVIMATYAGAEPSVGELRWISRLKGSLFTGVPAQSNLRSNTGWIESSDVGGKADGTTTSKYYGNQFAKDLTVRGVTGSGAGVTMSYGNRESSSGGPFFRDIQNQSGTDTELYNYMNSGHQQTDVIRAGVLHGPYALTVGTGAFAGTVDMSGVAGLGLTGYVAAAGRGRVLGNGLNGRDTNYTYIVGFSNATAQYWTPAAAGNGSFACYNMKPGTYTMSVYKNELVVYTESVTVTAGNPTTLNTRTITADPSAVGTIWRIGNWDGTPREFKNGGNISQMHPSDVRNASWGPSTFTLGAAANTFPAIQFRGANTPTTIKFNLTAAQAAVAHTIKIGISSAYIGGRPSIVVNGHGTTNPGASGQPNSRSVTIGTYRGNNASFSWSVPTSSFVTGTNTMTIGPISGSSDSGAWLSANFAYDCVELQ